MIDSSKYNNIYQYESGIGYFGFQKYYNVENYGKDGEIQNSCYYLLISSKIK